jgi:transposase-like protein
MRAVPFDDMFALLTEAHCSAGDVARLREWIASNTHPDECIVLIEQAARGRPCPRCGSPRAHRCGQASGLQRFRCLGCGRSYNSLTGTPLARLRKKERWLAYLQCVLESRTVREAARVAGVHRTTSFRWRHRFVPGAMRDRPATLSAIVEADETYRLESQKGSRNMTRKPRRRGGVAQKRGISNELDCLLVARDRSGQTLDFHTGRGQVTVAQLHKCLKPVLPADVLLISDSALSYRHFARQAGIMHEAVDTKTGGRARGAIHLQNVNAWHSRFKSWLVRFRGVASRYLINYSGWQRVLDARRLTTPAHLLCVAVQLG